MSLVPYDPFGIIRREFGSLPRWVDEDWFDNQVGSWSRIRVDVRETPTEVIVSAEIPGLNRKEDVNIVVHENHLSLSGKIERQEDQTNENIHRTERFYGQFTRNIALPTTVDETSAKASYHNGILEVRLPKTKKQVGQQIDVEFH
ncbi:Hsp20/alpha crystallin family protein [Sulfoacidibacillus thermotolerans]|uniref:Heat-shock protein Hsp20 n=1 Tax=Sulfoacidibacillus thermotolerans TaxID=1765684 RepID=A0A2U3DCA0_SULT2|nr:Hsp20/alpha crystallin family protein [Sulfoacidibacillus thermotolerans]PWI58910.1 heat-shock protein Hsp20 [Sulfoacidibacillus thermotolerans]